MTKKDYELIARVLDEHTGCPMKFSVVAGFARELKEDNPKFDAEKFRQACYSKVESRG